MINRYASLRQGLVGAWCPSLGASGFRLIDRSGYGNHGTLTNMDPGTDWVPSGGKLALDFDGSNDGVRVESDRYSYSSGAISFWVATTTDSVRSAIAFQETTTFNNLFIVYLGDGATGVLSNELITIGSIKSAVSNIGAYTTTTRSELFDGKMHHVVAMSNGTTWILYLDGVQKTVNLGQGTNGSWMDVSNPSALSIGCRLANSNSPNLVLNGQLDDIRIYNRALTPSEISLLYTGGRGVGLMPERIKHRRKTSAAATNRRRRIIIGASS
jgi:hypothetical protein